MSVSHVWNYASAVGETGRELSRIGRDVERSVVENESALPIPPPFDVMAPEVGRLVSRRWPRPCEDAFAFLGGLFPRELAKLIERGGLVPADLTYAAEAMGRSADARLVRATLLPLLSHDSAVVREGAIYGLRRHFDKSVRERVSNLARADVSSAVRLAASEALEES